MCLYPTLVKNRKYTATKKNGGNIPPLPLQKLPCGAEVIDGRVLYIPIGCQKCIECRKKKAREWAVRMQEEYRGQTMKMHWITLTFSNEKIKELDADINKNIRGYDRDNAIATLGMRRFLERWRKQHKKSVRHWMVTELGHNGTENIHMHGFIMSDQPVEEIEKHWKCYIYKGGVATPKRINYCVKYIHKMDADHKEYMPIILCSKGMGKKYIERFDSRLNAYKENGETDETYKTTTGHVLGLPTYYRNNIYTEEQKEKLWIEKLDRGVRYVMGKEIDIRNGEELYYSALAEAQRKNDALGYGNNRKNWERKRYEEQRREMMLAKRIGNNSAAQVSPVEGDSGMRGTKRDQENLAIFIYNESPEKGLPVSNEQRENKKAETKIEDYAITWEMLKLEKYNQWDEKSNTFEETINILLW